MKLIAKLVVFLWDRSSVTVVIAAVAGSITVVGSLAVLRLMQWALFSAAHLKMEIAWMFIGIGLLTAVSRAASQIMIIHLGQNSIYDLRIRLVRKILSIPLRNLEELGPNGLLSSLSTDTVAISNAITVVPSLFIDVITIVLACVYITVLDGAGFLLLAVLTAFVVTVGSYWPSRVARRYFKQVRSDWDQVYQHFRALTDGIKELKLHRRRREAFLRNFASITASMRRNNRTGQNIQVLAQSWAGLISFILLFLVLFVLPNVVKINVKMLLSYGFMSFYILGSFRHILILLPTLINAHVSMEKLQSIERKLNLDSEERLDEPEQLDAGASLEYLELVHATHAYEKEREGATFTLGPLNMTFYPGELVFITGDNGSGKTTFAKLLTSLYVPDDGEIRINGRHVNDNDLEFYRQHFSMVFSDFYVFDTLLGLERPSLDREAREYLMKFQLSEKVDIINGKLSTTSLSHGQRKRLALMTAFLEDRPIYIFDEWAAEQSLLFKNIFYHQILPELKARGKTVIVISHDDRYYHVADRVIKLDYGKLCHDGPSGDSQDKPAEAPV
jgi:putative ATP-binding cassette transporter